jgi:diguanylate cyclase (GGDEF)-like protein
VLLDVDNFKKYNDTYGHYKGDNVLRIIAATVKSKLNREDDYFFRVGGEEFGIFFESSDEHKAKLFVEKIREEIEALAIEHLNNETFNVVTISFGLVSIKNRVNESKRIYEEADKQLYKAKELGRNQTCSKLYE